MQRKTPALESLFHKIEGLKVKGPQPYEKETPTQVFSCEYFKIF